MLNSDINNAVFKALADYDCRKIIFAIGDKQLTSLEIVTETGLPQSNVFSKLNTLQKCGLVDVLEYKPGKAGPRSRVYVSKMTKAVIEIDGFEPPKVRLVIR